MKERKKRDTETVREERERKMRNEIERIGVLCDCVIERERKKRYFNKIIFFLFYILSCSRFYI